MLSRSFITFACLAALTGCDDSTPATDAATDTPVPTDMVTTDVVSTDVVTTDVVATDVVTQNDAATDRNTTDAVTTDVATDSATPTDAVTTDSATPTDAVTTDSATPTDAASTFVAHAPCNSESDYRDATTVAFGGAVGNTYSPNCVRVHVGNMVTWTGSFPGHPLAPGMGGTAGSPVPMQSTGTTASATFAATGYFPYYCTFHGSATGGGMAGVVWVVP